MLGSRSWKFWKSRIFYLRLCNPGNNTSYREKSVFTTFPKIWITTCSFFDKITRQQKQGVNSR